MSSNKFPAYLPSPLHTPIWFWPCPLTPPGGENADDSTARIWIWAAGFPAVVLPKPDQKQGPTKSWLSTTYGREGVRS